MVVTENYDEKVSKLTLNSEVEAGKLVLKEASKRQEFLSVLDRVIEHAYGKFTNKYTKNPERIAWGRLISDCCKAGGKILNDAEIEEVKERLEVLELTVNKK